MLVYGILDRLAQNARAHIQGFLQRHVFTAPAAARWQGMDEWPPEPAHDDAERQQRTSPLPRSAALMDAYQILDLPFGAPLTDVNERWKTYLKRCHPDRFHNDPKRLADATELTRQLNAAHDRIEAAWKNAGSRSE